MRKFLTGICVVVGAVIAAASSQAISPDLQSLIDAENAFARAATQKGIRDSFLEFFSADSIALVPGPQSAVERLKKQTARPFTELELTWEPRAGEIAASGNFGWLTGPSTFIDHTAPGSQSSYGNYLSVWRRETGGRWRVFIDFGCPVPAPAEFPAGFTRVIPPLPAATASAAGPEPAGSVANADMALNQQIATSGFAAAYAPVFAPDGTRLHRRNAVPRVGRTAIVEFAASLDRDGKSRVFKTGGSGAASSGDLAYTYGLAGETSAYVRVWAHAANGAWWLMVEATSAE